MKKFTLSLALFAATASVFAHGGEEKDVTTYKVQTNESTVTWVGEKVTGSHTGNIGIKEGVITFEKDMIESANITIDMTSITVTDERMDDGTKAKLKGHLDSPDFFHVEEHQTAQFQLTSFEPITSEDGMYMATGKLTIKGKTEVISFPTQVRFENGALTVSADLTFDRSKFDIRYGSDSFFDNLGDRVIYDDVKINFTLIARG